MKKILILSVMILALLVISACSHNDDSVAKKQSFSPLKNSLIITDPRERPADCGDQICQYVETHEGCPRDCIKDAGKECDTTKECIGYCLPDDPSQYQIGDEAAGHCQRQMGYCGETEPELYGPKIIMDGKIDTGNPCGESGVPQEFQNIKL